MFEQWKDKYRQFCLWQRAPYCVKAMSEQAHECPTCGRHYVGNYCPQCGQSSTIGRYSFKKAVLLYLDVWGLGNRGMFRTVRDLFLRPGYMIRDYLGGMQMAYFPPFKMLFLLLALQLLVNSGVNIKGENRLKATQEEYEEAYKQSLADKRQALRGSTAVSSGEEGLRQEKKQNLSVAIDKGLMDYNSWSDRHKALDTLLLLLVLSGPLYLVFRHCPNIPDMRFSEFFVALVYITNMLTVIAIVMDFFCLAYFEVTLLLPLLMVIPLKQLSGYSYWSALLRTVAVFLLIIIAALAVFVAGALLYAKTDIIG